MALSRNQKEKGWEKSINNFWADQRYHLLAEMRGGNWSISLSERMASLPSGCERFLDLFYHTFSSFTNLTMSFIVRP
jgi:hypothetical protein